MAELTVKIDLEDPAMSLLTVQRGQEKVGLLEDKCISSHVFLKLYYFQKPSESLVIDFYQYLSYHSTAVKDTMMKATQRREHRIGSLLTASGSPLSAWWGSRWQLGRQVLCWTVAGNFLSRSLGTAENEELGLTGVCEISQPSPRDIPPPRRPHILILSKQFTSWGLNTQIHEPIGAIFVRITSPRYNKDSFFH